MNSDQALWCEVLSLAISDALTGTSSASKSRATRINEIERNRKYLTIQNSDFDMVCSLAGVDPVATREHLIRRIANAPAPEQLISVKRRAQRRALGARQAQQRRVAVQALLDDGVRSRVFRKELAPAPARKVVFRHPPPNVQLLLHVAENVAQLKIVVGQGLQ